MALEIEKVGKFFLKIGNAGYMIGCFKADINTGMGIAYIKDRQEAIGFSYSLVPIACFS